MPLTLAIPTVDVTKRLANALAQCLHITGPGIALLCHGPLGAGKTTLIHAMVADLPGGEQAEVSSPSFNLCNIYPTQPEIAHYDLYRLAGTGQHAELYDYMEEDRVIIVEWAEYLPADIHPEQALILVWQVCDTKRLITIRAVGNKGRRMLADLARRTIQLTA